MWRLALIGIAIAGISLFGFSLIDISGGTDVTANTVLAAPQIDTSGFTQAIGPYDWQFPADFGPHPDYQTEWWYYTGNLAATDADGSERRFGYQFTIFRRAITPQETQSNSEWRTNQMYLAHFTVSDIANNDFRHAERFSRSSAGLAGATTDPRYRVWVADWEILAQTDDASIVTIQAQAEDFAVDLTLEQIKPPALQGDGGLSPKSAEPGNASYYYSLTRLPTEGTIRLDNTTYSVSGLTWKDHEFSTSALGSGAEGWDWFGLIFDDNTELMIGQIRLTDGGIEPAFGGLRIYADGSTRYLDSSEFTITATDTWLSPHTDVTYPAGWQIEIAGNPQEPALQFNVQPLMNDQELYDTQPAYWEGAVRVTGDVSGYGYAELTGYVDPVEGSF